MTKKFIKLSKCKNINCNANFDKKEIERINGKDSMVCLSGFCSASCYTQHVIKEDEKLF